MTSLQPITETADQIHAALDEAEKAPVRQLPFWLDKKIKLQLWWMGLKIRLQLRLRTALGVERDMAIVTSHIQQHEGLITTQRSDFDSYEESNQLRHRQLQEGADRADRIGERLRYYEQSVGIMEYQARHLRKMKPALFE